MRILLLFFMLTAGTVLLPADRLPCSTSPARPNVLINGSFENGLVGWEAQGTLSTATGGYCGTHLANMPLGFLRQTGYRLEGGVRYKLAFRFRGALETSVTGGERLRASDWTRVTRRFTAERTGDTLWFMSFPHGAQLDCVRLVKLP